MTRPDPFSAFRLDGKTALVTGAGRGIGLGAAQALCAAGAAVTLVARTRGEIDAAAAELTGQGGAATALALDVTDLAAVTEAVGRHGPFDILVNNAGTNRPAPFLEVTAEDFDVLFGLNVRAAYFVAQAVARGLVAAGRPGAIVNISSQMGHVGAENRSVYCATKHAMEGFTKAMAVELGRQGIRVNSVCPTFIETPMVAGFFADDPEFRKTALSKNRLGRLGAVDDVVGAILYLASDASALVTGAALKVDAGWTAS